MSFVIIVMIIVHLARLAFKAEQKNMENKITDHSENVLHPSENNIRWL